MKINLILIILSSICLNSGIFSQLNQSSIYLSFDNYFDNIEYENIDNQLVDISANMYKTNIGYVHKGNFEFSLSHIENRSDINNYYLYDKSYLGIDFYYYLNDFKKIPINFKIGTNYMRSGKNNLNSLIICLYKELAGGGNYPVIPFLKLGNTSVSNINQNYSRESFTSLSLGMHLKLIVDANNNSSLKDIIWLGAHLMTTDQSYYFIGFDIGLYHPIK